MGSDSYAFDWANRMTSATVGGPTATFKYAGDDSSLSKIAAGATIPYIWARTGGLPMLLDGCVGASPSIARRSVRFVRYSPMRRRACMFRRQ